MPKKLTLQEAKKLSLERGFKFLDNKYENINHKHNFKCLKHAEIHKISILLIKRGHSLNCCRKESYVKNGIKQRISSEEIKKKTLDKGFEFLDNEYLGNKYKHSFRCIVDNEIHQKSWNGLTRGEGLKCCQRRKLSEMNGNKNNNWKNELTTQDRIDRKRKNVEDNKWKKIIKERDNYQCQICNSKEKLHAHHLESWSSNKELRCEISNGVTLCQNHHILFHREYGKLNNTRKQFYEFRNNI